MKNAYGLVCCFCDEKNEKEMIRFIVQSLDPSEEAEQYLFCHAICMEKRLKKNIPFLFFEGREECL